MKDAIVEYSGVNCSKCGEKTVWTGPRINLSYLFMDTATCLLCGNSEGIQTVIREKRIRLPLITEGTIGRRNNVLRKWHLDSKIRT